MSIFHFVEEIGVSIHSFNQNCLDFYLKLVYSIRVHFLKFALKISLIDFSLNDKVPCTSLESQNSTWDKASNFLTATFLKTSVFHLFKKPFEVFQFFWQNKA